MRYLAALVLFCLGVCAQNPETARFPGAVATDKTLFVAANNATSTLTAAITSTSQTVFLNSSTALFIVPTIVRIGTESIAICAKGEASLTVCTVADDGFNGRGFSGTTATTHINGSTVTGTVDRSFPNKTNAEIKAIETALGVNLANVEPKSTGHSGTATVLVTTTGTQTNGDCVTIDANGNHVAAGAACGSGGGGSGDPTAILQAAAFDSANAISVSAAGSGRAQVQTPLHVDPATGALSTPTIDDPSLYVLTDYPTSPAAPGTGLTELYAVTGLLKTRSGASGAVKILATTDQVPTAIFSGSQTLGVAEIAANACAATIEIDATGVVSTDNISLTENGNWSAVTGYGKASTDGLLVYKWPTTGHVSIAVCNGTGAAITPGAATVNIQVVR